MNLLEVIDVKELNPIIRNELSIRRHFEKFIHCMTDIVSSTIACTWDHELIIFIFRLYRKKMVKKIFHLIMETGVEYMYRKRITLFTIIKKFHLLHFSGKVFVLIFSHRCYCFFDSSNILLIAEPQLLNSSMNVFIPSIELFFSQFDRLNAFESCFSLIFCRMRCSYY